MAIKNILYFLTGGDPRFERDFEIGPDDLANGETYIRFALDMAHLPQLPDLVLQRIVEAAFQGMNLYVSDKDIVGQKLAVKKHGGTYGYFDVNGRFCHDCY